MKSTTQFNRRQFVKYTAFSATALSVPMGLLGNPLRPGITAEPKKSECPLIPMGAITGKPDQEQIREYLEHFKNVGIDQFLIYPRSGLELVYMSDEWLDVCGYIIEYATKNEMSVWLYDEYNWPSGKCGGQVIDQNPDFACKKISVWADFDPIGNTIGHLKEHHKYYWTVSSVPLYADLLSAEAVETFIALTHEKYYNRFGKYFGKLIKGFFTDEPSPVYAALHHKTHRSLLELPYWKELEFDYQDLTNRDFKSDVEAYLDGLDPVKLWENYFSLLGKKFKSAYLDRINNWCTSHNVLLAGHLMSETNPYSSLWASGNPMEAINSFSMPGIDETDTKTTVESIEWVTMKMIGNASGEKRNGALAELFAKGPCDMPLAKMRQMIWLTALHGVDHYVLAIAPLDAKGNIGKPNYYSPFTPTQPWFTALKELGDEAGLAALYAKKKSQKKVAVRYPQSLTASKVLFPKKERPVWGLPELLRDLVKWQWDPLLIAETQYSDCDVVLSISKSGVWEERSGKNFSSPEELSFWLGQNFQRGATVEDATGKQLDNLLIKTFEDGSACIVSLQDAAQRQLTLKQPGAVPVLFDLPEYGVFIYQPGRSIAKIENEIILLPEELLPYQLLSSNTMRIVFDEAGRFEFTVNDALDGLTFICRNFKDMVRMELDGKELVLSEPCHILPKGLKELYLESGKISVGKGTHILNLKSKSPDYPYLPSAFIGGDFALGENNIIKALPQTLSIKSFRSQGLLNYVGGIIFRKRVTLNNEEFLSVDTGGLVSEAFINNQSLGRRAWAPFSWEIPAKLRNRAVDLEILVTNSVGPLFGKYPKEIGEEGSVLRRFAPK